MCLALSPLPSLEGRTAVGQRQRRPDPETYHWVLPAQHSGVEVAELHPNDCYAIQRAEGMVYFGAPLPDVLELQRQLGEPRAHLVDGRDGHDGHPECLLGGCFDVSRLRDAITARLLESGDRQYRRPIGHRPTPLDDLRGGAYSDVGSDDRPRYRQAPEQRMVYLHLGTAGRGNCYEAKAPRTLTIHIRDHEQRTDRTGVYTGYLYVEHHHPAPAGLAARGESPAAFDRRCIPPACVAPRSNTAGIFLRRAVPDGRITSLGAMPDLHHGLLVAASRTWGVSHPF